MPYRSPHKLRHGHAVYALEKCETVADLKAVSQNLVHQSLVTTDSIYSVLGGATVGERIAGLGETSTETRSHPTLDESVSTLVERLRAVESRVDLLQERR